MGELRGGDIFIAFPLWMLGSAAVSIWQDRPEPLAIGAFLGLALWTLRSGSIGWANALTWLRILVTASLVLFAAGSTDLVVTSFLIFAFDAVDGAIARRRGTVSDFGAELDKECDAFFVLMTSTLLYLHAAAGGWILIVGAWRYVYILVVGFFESLRPAPRSNWGRYSYAISCLLLIAALWEGTPMTEFFALAATLIISLSFGRSLYYGLSRS